jgi:TatD DNase family protein
MYFDSHTHLDTCVSDDYSKDEVISDIEDSDVDFVVDIGFDLPSSEIVAANAALYPWCYAAVGVHPHEVEVMDESTLDALRVLLAQPKVVAVGEIGLDYYRDLSPRDLQQFWFRRQIQLALELDMPITVHDRDSEGDTLRILEEEGAFSGERRARFAPNPVDGIPDARVLLHCFSGDADAALALIDKGATISIAGPVTYKKNDMTKEVARRVPLEHLLVETDAPYLAPVPMRGKPNKTPFVKFTSDYIAELRNVEFDAIAEATSTNAKRFFGIK